MHANSLEGLLQEMIPLSIAGLVVRLSLVVLVIVILIIVIKILQKVKNK